MTLLSFKGLGVCYCNRPKERISQEVGTAGAKARRQDALDGHSSL